MAKKINSIILFHKKQVRALVHVTVDTITQNAKN